MPAVEIITQLRNTVTGEILFQQVHPIDESLLHQPGTEVTLNLRLGFIDRDGHPAPIASFFQGEEARAEFERKGPAVLPAPAAPLRGRRITVDLSDASQPT